MCIQFLLLNLRRENFEAMKKTLLMVLMAVGLTAAAQTNLKTSGRTVQDLVPEGWEDIHEATGDLNKDGVADLVVIATPNLAEHMNPESDYATNYNVPVVGIYWGQRDGSYKLYQQYDSIVSGHSEYIYVENSVKVTDKGVLQFESTTFATAGTSESGNDTYLFRYQKGDFYLIGQQNTAHSRYTGDFEEVSINYLTHKKKITTGSVLKDGPADKVRWEKIPKEPLMRLGSFTM